MKNYILILFVFLAMAAIAQNETPLVESSKEGSSATYSEQMSTIITELDKTEITTGILTDKSFGFVLMDDFNGVNTKVISLEKWREIYGQLYNSQIDNRKKIPLLESFPKAIFNTKLGIDVVPIAIMNIDYNRFKEDVLKNNLLTFSNGKLHDVLGRDSSPYLTNKLFASTPLKNKLYSSQVVFKISSQLIIQNTENQLLSVEMDFDDGKGYVNVWSSGEKERDININYLTIGDKIIKTKANFINGASLKSSSTFSILSLKTASYNANFNISGAWGGASATGTAYVLYGCGNNNQLRKPIIVSDGFDPSDERHFNEIYGLMNKANLIEKLIAEGFDVIILDYNSGADYIQRNAQVLISTINNLNTQLATNGSNAQLVVIGPSMAGLISRYALSYMEQNNMNHNTGLYISFDSPHLGANVPLGDQYWLDFFAQVGGSQGAADGRAILNTTAAQQMLIYHSSTFPYQNSLRTNLINDPYFSFPTMCRKVAFSNGSTINSNRHFVPSTQIISYRYRNFWVDIDGNAWAVPDHPSSPTTVFYGVIDIFGPQYTKWDIPIYNTYPYDGAAGGWTDATGQIAEGDTDGRGDITTNYPKNCFIPMVSALALTGIYKVNLNFSAQYLTNYPYVKKLNTPFDAIYAASSNEEHVHISNTTADRMMNEIAATELFLQNKTVNSPTDFQARNTILAGNNITNSIAQGDFIVQNNVGVVNIAAGEKIVLEPGTTLKPSGSGSVHLFINPYPCNSLHFKQGASYSRNFNDEELPKDFPFISQKESERAFSGIEDTKEEVYMKAYPNPCSEHIHIEYLLKEKADIEILLFNLKGEKLRTINIGNTDAGRKISVLNTKELISGIYICVITKNGEISGSIKIKKN